MAWKNVQYENGKYRTNEGGGGGGSSTFAGLDDVNFTNLQNGQVPKYNSTTQKWENADESGGGGTVTDVQVDGTSVVNPQTGVAEITMPTPPTFPVEDVEVNGESVVNAQKVAEIKSYKEVTQAEYNALPDSKLNDGILYAIKDSAGADGFPPLIYSDEEREVGVWRDGKPLYQRTFVANFTGATSIELENSGIGYAQQIASSYVSSNILDTPFFLYQSTYVFCYIDVRDNGRMLLYNNYNGSIQWTVTVQYTKLTDTPGSGTWTTDGTYAKHYSTEEKVIGTWIDGKPLYERTFAYNISPVNDWTLFDDSVSYDLLIDARGYHKNLILEVFPLVVSDATNPRWCIQPDHKLYYFISNNVTRSGYITLQYTKTTD